MSGEAENKEVTLYLILRDNVDEDNYEETAVLQAMDILCLGYDGMYRLADHAAILLCVRRKAPLRLIASSGWNTSLPCTSILLRFHRLRKKKS